MSAQLAAPGADVAPRLHTLDPDRGLAERHPPTRVGETFVRVGMTRRAGSVSDCMVQLHSGGLAGAS